MPVYQHYNDHELLSLLKSSDDRAFRELYDRYWKLLFSVAANKITSLPDVEEMVQDVFADIWNRRATIEITASLKAYLAQAIKFKIYSYLLRLQKQRKREGQPVITTVPLTPENELDFKNLIESVLKNISDLPATAQLIYHLKEEGLTNKQVADMMGVSVKTIENHTTITKRHLRTGLDYVFFIFFR